MACLQIPAIVYQIQTVPRFSNPGYDDFLF